MRTAILMLLLGTAATLVSACAAFEEPVLPPFKPFADRGADSSDLFARQARWSHLNDDGR